MKSFLAFLVPWAALGVAADASAEQGWLDAPRYTEVQAVIGPRATQTDRNAARIFATWWERTTGQQAPISAEPDARRVNAWIGTAGLPEDLRALVDLEGLGTDGIVIRTVAPGEAPGLTGAHLILAGGEPRGTLYAVYAFFETAFGVRWLAPGVTHIPPAPAILRAIDHRHVPPFIYRDSSYYQHWPGKEEYELANRISRNPRFGLFVHTFYPLLPPDAHFPEHPEYYSEVDGARRAPWDYDWRDEKQRADHSNSLGQLCMANPATAEALVEALLPRIRSDPEARVWSVSQNDWGGQCECDLCAAIDEREGTPMGSLLTGVNRVADGIRAEFPDHYVETIAYMYSRKPPASLKPRDNVVIRLCSIECDFARPLDDPASPANRSFAENMRDWARTARNVQVWDYTPSFYCYHAPHPNFHVLQPNLQFFAENNVTGMFEQGAEALAAEFCHLRGYMLARLMWDPWANGDEIRDEFIDLYYREAGPFIRDYIELITNRVLAEGVPMGCFDEALWMDYPTVTRAQEIFRNALAATESEEVRQRVEQERLAVDWAALACPPEIEYEGDRLTARRPPGPTLEDYLSRARSLGFRHRESLENTLRRTGGRTPPLEIEATLVRLENERSVVWIVPESSGAVIRWRDKERGVELLRGYERSFFAYPGTWEDWVSTPFRTEGPAAEEYGVAARSGRSVTLQSETADGLVVERTMALLPDSGRLDVTVTVRNPTARSIDAAIKMHPEFWNPGPTAPEIWAEGGEGWKRLAADIPAHQAAHGDYIDAADCRRLAAWLPERSVAIVCEHEGRSVGSLLYFYNTDPVTQQVNLEIIPRREPLAPGETRTIRGAYWVTGERPGVGDQ